MAEHISLGMVQMTLTPNSRILAANRVLALMLGYDTGDELSGTPASDLFIRPGDFDDLAGEIMRDGNVTGRRISLKRKDGSDLWVSVQAWKLQSQKSPEWLIEAFVEDITEHLVFEQEMHYHESELNRYALALALANKKLNILSSITRHDLLNKLTGLSGYLELMKGDFPDEKIQEYLAIQEKIIQTIILHVRFTKDYQDIGIDAPQWFDVNLTIGSAVASLSLPGITPTIETGNLSIYADPMLERVFYNLIENSLRHAGKLTRISFHTEIADETARIIYEDDGCGVPEEYKEAIFIRKHFKHTGFGLYLSKEILGITGLSIRETGKPGNGARFEITIPRKNYRAGE